jgi:hypothetical protein
LVVDVIAGTIPRCGMTETFRKRSGREWGNCTFGARIRQGS